MFPVLHALTCGSVEEASLDRYAQLLQEWAPRLNLVALGDLDRVKDRHIADALRALPLVDGARPGPCIDVGSGAGLPGVPLAIARPERPWRLLEPRKKRVAFLEEVVRDLGLENCEVVAKTAEEAAADSRYSTKHALAIARALAPPAEAVRLMMPLVAPEGSVALFIGRGATLPPGAEEVSEGLAIVRADKGKEGSADAGTIF